MHKQAHLWQSSIIITRRRGKLTPDPPPPLVGVSTGMQRGRQQNGRVADVGGLTPETSTPSSIDRASSRSAS